MCPQQTFGHINIPLLIQSENQFFLNGWEVNYEANFLKIGDYAPCYMFDSNAIEEDIGWKAHSMLSKVSQLCGGAIATLRVNTLIKQ